MVRLKSFLLYLYRHHFIRYLFVGGTTFLIDFSILFFLHEVVHFNLALATSIAYWASITFNFLLNRSWTFSASEKKKLHEHALFYGLLLSFNYLYTVIAVSILSHFMYFGIAKLIAVITQVSWTYFLYKNYVFGSNKTADNMLLSIKKYLKKTGKLKVSLILVGVFLYTCLFFSSFKTHALNTQNNIDGSWSYALASLRHSDFQSLGNDTFFTYGPLSVKIITTVHHQDGLVDFLVSIGLISILYALCLSLIVYALSEMRIREILAVIGLLLLTLIGEPSIDMLFLATLLISLPAVFSSSSLLTKHLLLSGPLIISTYKNNMLITWLLIMALLSLSAKRPIQKLLSLGAFVISYYLVLVALGVSVFNVPAFLIYSIKDALAYNEFMALTTYSGYTVTFFIVLLFFGSAKLVLFINKNVETIKNIHYTKLLPLIAEVWVLWVAFKEASTRSDGHIIFFFPFLFYMASSLIMSAYPNIRNKVAYYAWLPACFLPVMVISVINAPHILGTPKRFYAKRTIKNFLLIDAAHRYSYSYFKYQRFASQVGFNGLVSDVSDLRSSLADFSKMSGHKDPVIVGYTNTIFYLPAVTANYRYAPFLQTYQAFPTQLFDRLFTDYLVSNPDTLVFWTNINPAIDGRIPNYDLPGTYKFIQDNYTIVAQDDSKGLFVYGKNSSNKIELPKNCATIVKKSFTNTPTNLDLNTKHFSVKIHDNSHFLIDILYKKPVFSLYLFNEFDQNKIYRTTPSLLSVGIDTDPFIPSLKPAVANENFKVNRFMVYSSDSREAELTITQKICQ